LSQFESSDILCAAGYTPFNNKILSDGKLMKQILSPISLLFSSIVVVLMLVMSSFHFSHAVLLIASFICFNLFLNFGKHRTLSLVGLINKLIFITFTVISVLFYIANFFTGNGITFDVLSHLSPHSFSAAFYAFETYQKAALVALALFGVLYFVSPRKPQNKMPRNGLYIASIVLMFGLHPLITSSAKLFYQLGMSDSSEVVLQLIKDNHHSDESIEEARKTLKNPPNVLLIYLESMERTYFDTRYYQNLMTELEDVSKQSLDFTNVDMPWGATHTIAGMVSSLCGVPINAPRGGMHQDGDSDVYMPKAQCLGDITKKLGYDNLFYQGASLNFSNKGGFMRSHGFDEVKGRTELADKTTVRANMGPWGLHDDVLLEKVKSRLQTLFDSDRSRPFFFTMLTLDTHDAFGENRVSKWCNDNGPGKYQGADHAIQNAVYCSDKLISQFVSEVKQRWGDDLLIILTNDHEAYPFNVGKKLKLAEQQKQRRMLFSFVNAKEAPKPVSRNISTLDIGATVLGYITDHKINTIGIGTSAFNETRENLLEQQGMQALNRTLMSSDFAIGKSLWKMSSFKNSDISIDPVADTLIIKDSKYALPVALMLDDNGTIIDFYGKDVRRKVSLLKVSPRLIWAGECKYIDGLVDVQGKSDETCLYIGNLAAKGAVLTELTKSTVIRYQDYETILQGQTNFDLFNDRLYMQKKSNSNLEKVKYTSVDVNGSLAIIDFFSTMHGIKNMLGYTVFPTMSERLSSKRGGSNKYGYPKGNGFYLFEINDGLVNDIYYWKTCSSNHNFQSMNQVLKNNNKSQAFVLVSARRVRCDGDNLDSYFRNSPFQSAALIKERQPYISFWERGDDEAYTVSAPAKENIQLRLINRELLEKKAP